MFACNVEPVARIFAWRFIGGKLIRLLGGGVPAELTQQLDSLRVVMKGTYGRPVRCVALEGAVGQCVRCTIYEVRPTPCQELQAAWVNGLPSEQCDRARLAWGLAPLVPVVETAVFAEPSGVQQGDLRAIL